jgi:hypothetical protein
LNWITVLLQGLGVLRKAKAYLVFQSFTPITLTLFNSSTNIRFFIPGTSQVELQVFDVAGRLVRTLVDKSLAAGSHTIRFNTEGLGSGVYFYQLKAGGTSDVEKMLLIQ